MSSLGRYLGLLGRSCRFLEISSFRWFFLGGSRGSTMAFGWLSCWLAARSPQVDPDLRHATVV